jgi:hypothetical protein
MDGAIKHYDHTKAINKVAIMTEENIKHVES